ECHGGEVRRKLRLEARHLSPRRGGPCRRRHAGCTHPRRGVERVPCRGPAPDTRPTEVVTNGPTPPGCNGDRNGSLRVEGPNGPHAGRDGGEVRSADFADARLPE